MERAQLHRGTLALVVLSTTGSALACSGVGPPGLPVVFGDQTNIVIWDKVHQTEHFIRNANFKSGANNFGFIAPTPGKPQLEEASTQAFYTLASLQPYPSPAFGAGGLGGGGGFGGASRSDEVKVIQEADVSGYHATTLWAKSAVAINDWMNEHGYVSTPEVEEWADRYCKRGWYLTAFKVMDKSKLVASTGTIRMTFKTVRPYNPFYVPATNIPVSNPGTLKVYFVAKGNYDAHIGPKGETWETPQWSAPIPWNTSDLLASQVKLAPEDIPERAQVETFVDPNFPRPAEDDIYFEQPPEVKIVKPQPPRNQPVPLLASMLAGVGILGSLAKRIKSSTV